MLAAIFGNQARASGVMDDRLMASSSSEGASVQGEAAPGCWNVDRVGRPTFGSASWDQLPVAETGERNAAFNFAGCTLLAEFLSRTEQERTAVRKLIQDRHEMPNNAERHSYFYKFPEPGHESADQSEQDGILLNFSGGGPFLHEKSLLSKRTSEGKGKRSPDCKVRDARQRAAAVLRVCLLDV